MTDNIPQSADGAHGKQLKVLLVDDDSFLLDMYSLKFKKSDIDVDAVSSSTVALEKLRAGSIYDIIIFDIIMPGLDGLDFLKKIREEKILPGVTMIVLTNQADDAEKAKAFGVDDYIIKATAIPSEVVGKVLAVYKSKTGK